MTDVKIEFSPAAAHLAERLLEPALEIISRYPQGRGRSALLPLLHLVQTAEGHVSPQGVAFCAEVLGINKAQVGAVATFYTMYKRRPTGEYLVSVCTNTLCNVMGGQEVYDQLSEHLGVGHDETTADGKITLEHAECLAACDYAPVVTVNYDFTLDEATPEGAIGMVDGLRNGQRPTPSRGARVCTLKEMQMQLAGFDDVREGAVADGPAGAPTLRGVSLAQEHGIAVANFDPETPITSTKPARDEGAKAVPNEGPVPPRPARIETSRTSSVKKALRSVVSKVAGKPDAKVAGKSDDPETRAAEQRNPDASTPAKDPAATGTPKAVPTNQAEAAGLAGNQPAGDGKPVGDERESIAPAAEKAATSGNEETK